VIAVVPVRAGGLVAGSTAAIAEAGGVAIVVGDGAVEAARALAGRALDGGAEAECRELRALELGAFRPASWAAAVAPHVVDCGAVVLPASPDGRDLAPRLAAELGWPLLAGAVRVTAQGASLAWRDGRQIAQFRVDGPFVATLLPGSRNTLMADDVFEAPDDSSGPPATTPDVGAPGARTDSGVPVLELEAVDAGLAPADAQLVEVMAADPAVMDLEEASRIIGAGAGIGGPQQVATLQLVAAGLGASVGATRVVTDAGWLGHDRQIGTTGVSVRPRCYVAFGVSGAAQHVGGLGTPRHVVSVNSDRSCPMTAMADLALVTDASGMIDALARRLAAVLAAGDLAEPAPAGLTASPTPDPTPGSGSGAPPDVSASEHVDA